MRRRQQGMTFIGLLFVLAMAGALLYAGIRLAPLYLNYMKVARSLDAVASESKADNPDPAALRSALSRQWEIQSLDSPDFKEVEITKEDNGVTLHVAYDDSVPYIGNVSLSVHFEKTTKVQ
ncbi:MAG: DUF4845 domain-containing protein [Steroidobacteraceae bacterium]